MIDVVESFSSGAVNTPDAVLAATERVQKELDMSRQYSYEWLYISCPLLLCIDQATSPLLLSSSLKYGHCKSQGFPQTSTKNVNHTPYNKVLIFLRPLSLIFKYFAFC